MVGFLMSFGMALGIPPIISGAIAGGIIPDGSAACNASTSCFLTLTTSSANDVIIVAQATNQNGNCGPPATPTAPGLSFAIRARSNAGIGYNNQNICEYYAISSVPLASVTIACSPGYVNGRTSCIAFGIANANTASPFDGVPCTNYGTSTTPSCLITTSNANDLLIGLSTNVAGTTATAGSGFSTIIDQSSDTNGNSYAEYKMVSTLQSGASVGLTYAASVNWAIIGDAIKASSSPTTTTATTSTTSTSTITTTTTAGQVTQPVVFGPANTPVAFISVSGGNANPTAFYANAATVIISANPNCTLTFTLPSGWYFLIGTVQTQSVTFQTCASGSCNPINQLYYPGSMTTSTTTATITITSSGTVITTTVTSTTTGANPFTLPAAWTANPFNFAAGIILIPFGVIIYTKKNDGG